MLRFLLIIKHFANVIFLSIKDGANYIVYTEVLPSKLNKVERLQFQLTVGIHSLEKGLSYINKKKNFGEVKATKQLKTLQNYLRKGYPSNVYAVLETIAIMKTYIEYKNNVGESVPEIEALYDDCEKMINNSSPAIINYCSAGVDILSKKDLVCLDAKTCISFMEQTRSVRNFDNTQNVKEDEIISAISIARLAPSACNRQPIKIYYSMDVEKNITISRIVPGNKGFENQIPNYLVVTASKNYFGLFEYNQWYVNGGVFLSYLRLALHSVNLGHCIFQWATSANEKDLRSLCKIPKNEAIIAIVGIGHYAEKTYCIKAQRKSVIEYISKF